MRHTQTIQRLLASIMLLLFVTSITPKRFLHHWFANHKDVQVRLSASNSLGGQEQMHSDGIKCDCDHLVATSPFTYQSIVLDLTVPICYGQLITPLTCNTYSTDLVFSKLRGPPNMA